MMGWGTAQAQLPLSQGQNYIYSFETLDLVGQVFTPPPGQGQFGKFTLQIDTSPITQPSSMMVEFFQNDPTQPAAFSQVLDFPVGPSVQFRVGDLWEDLQGALRLSMLQGSTVINSFFLEVELPTTTPGMAQLYRSSTIVPIPEPSTWSLAGLGMLLGGCFVLYRRRQLAH